jgi:hypothetical protein
VKYYNNMHSYSQLVLLSWGYTTEPPPNYMDFVRQSLSLRQTCFEMFFQLNLMIFNGIGVGLAWCIILTCKEITELEHGSIKSGK